MKWRKIKLQKPMIELKKLKSHKTVGQGKTLKGQFKNFIRDF